jgi:PP-loop superfamily ATP-utilizing enzyme
MALTHVEVLEDFLFSLGFTDVRARFLGDSLLIEVPENELEKLFSAEIKASIITFGENKDLPKIEFSNLPLRSGSFSAQHLESQHV